MAIKWLVFLSCGNCQCGVMAHILQKSNDRAVSPHDYRGGLGGTRAYAIDDIYPKKEAVDAPDHTPENIRYFYRQAVNSLKPDYWDAAALMAGKVLEVTFKTILPDFSGNLCQRIEHLAQTHIITQDMKKWSHEIRLIRNEAAHAVDKVNPEDVKELMAFIEVFLMYTFTLPGMLESRKNSQD